jgi:medium-chain acyl-[acyl-carrier-protein] hydrolase
MIGSRVLPFRRVLAQPQRRLVCVPYGGGSASVYRRWSEPMAPAVEVCAVELPGHGVRFAEAAVSDMAALCDGLTDAIAPLFDGVAVALFGHSMGARVAFELARRFDGRVAHLFVSGASAPAGPPRLGAPDDRRSTAELSDDELKQRMRALGGTPSLILDDDKLMTRVLPVVRADFQLVEAYRIEPQVRVACPITVFAGSEDPIASPVAAAGWERRTTGAFRAIELAAGHFFLESHRGLLLAEIARDLSVADAR